MPLFNKLPADGLSRNEPPGASLITSNRMFFAHNFLKLALLKEYANSQFEIDPNKLQFDPNKLQSFAVWSPTRGIAI